MLPYNVAQSWFIWDCQNSFWIWCYVFKASADAKGASHRDGGKILFRLIDCCPGASTPPCFHAYITLVPLLSGFDAAYQHIVWRWDFGWSQHPTQILPLFWKLPYEGMPYGSIPWGNFPHENGWIFQKYCNIYVFGIGNDSHRGIFPKIHPFWWGNASLRPPWCILHPFGFLLSFPVNKLAFRKHRCPAQPTTNWHLCKRSLRQRRKEKEPFSLFLFLFWPKNLLKRNKQECTFTNLANLDTGGGAWADDEMLHNCFDLWHGILATWHAYCIAESLLIFARHKFTCLPWVSTYDCSSSRGAKVRLTTRHR